MIKSKKGYMIFENDGNSTETCYISDLDRIYSTELGAK